MIAVRPIFPLLLENKVSHALEFVANLGKLYTPHLAQRSATLCLSVVEHLIAAYSKAPQTRLLCGSKARATPDMYLREAGRVALTITIHGSTLILVVML